MPRTSLRIVLLLVASLAGLKVWAQDRYYRGIMHEALIGAYKEKASSVCQKAAPKLAKAAWTGPEIRIGNAEADVAIWDFDNPLWDVRYRHPQLIMTTGAAQGSGKAVLCTYDLFVGLARIDGAVR